MKIINLQIITLSLIVFCFMNLSAQEVVVPTGGDAFGNGGSVSFSVGQIAYKKFNEPNFSVTQGVQQPYEISALTSINHDVGIEPELIAYPNPAGEFLKLKVESEKLKELKYGLFDHSGKIIESKYISTTETVISVENLVPATYYLKIFTYKNMIKIFKIIKH